MANNAGKTRKLIKKYFLLCFIVIIEIFVSVFMLQADVSGYAYLDVPYYTQSKGYYCGPACLSMVFDYWGPFISQGEIADAARTDGTYPNPYGTIPYEMRRAGHFSDMSTSAGESADHVTGYTGRGLGYAAYRTDFTLQQIKEALDAGCPVIVLMYAYDPDNAFNFGHFRVVIGYDDSANMITLHDPYIGSFSLGQDAQLSYSDFEEYWEFAYSYNRAILTYPWDINMSLSAYPGGYKAGDICTVYVNITYPSFLTSGIDDYTASSCQATLNIPAGVSLAPLETATKVITGEGSASGILAKGQSVHLEWDIIFNSPGVFNITLEAEGQVSGSVSGHSSGVFTTSYSYTDRIGGTKSIDVTVESWPEPSVRSCTFKGEEKKYFLNQTPLNENIYIKGIGDASWAVYDLYIVNDVNIWTNGMVIPNRISGTATFVETNSRRIFQYLPATAADFILPCVWSNNNTPLVDGVYDIIVDINDNGIYNAGIDAIDNNIVISTPQMEILPSITPIDNTVYIPDTEQLVVTGQGFPPNTVVKTYVIPSSSLPVNPVNDSYIFSYAGIDTLTDTDGSVLQTFQASLPYDESMLFFVDVWSKGKFGPGDCYYENLVQITSPDSDPYLWIYENTYKFKGESLTLEGRNFPPEVTVDLNMDDNISLFSSDTTANGRLYAYFEVPDVISGIHDINAVYFDDVLGQEAVASISLVVIGNGEDIDSDGILNGIDIEPLLYSETFSDFHSTFYPYTSLGKTSGKIIDRGDQLLTIEEEPNPDGVRITSDLSGGPLPAIIHIFDKISSPEITIELIINTGEVRVTTSNSVIINAICGNIEINVSVLDYHHSSINLNEGNIITIRPYIYIAGENNTDDISLVVEGHPFIISSGQTFTGKHAPVAQARNIIMNEDASIPLTLGAIDIDNDVLEYFLVDLPANGTISGYLPEIVYNPNQDFNGQDSFVFKASDGIFESNLATVTITVEQVNDPPVADAGKDIPVIFIGQEVQLDGTGSWDPDGDALIYNWTIISIPDGSQVELDNNLAVKPVFYPDKYGAYIFSLVVSDACSSSLPDEVTVSFDNIKPVAVGSENKSCIAGETVFLDGSESYDENNDPITFIWQIIERPETSNAELTNSNTAATYLVTDIPGQYIISLIVFDGNLYSDPYDISIVAISFQSIITMTIHQAIDKTNGMSKFEIKNPKMLKSLTNKLNALLKMVDDGNYKGAYNKLINDISGKMNGCAEDNIPDKNDWIISCEAQARIFPLILDAIRLLAEKI